MADYYFARTVDGDMESVVERVTDALKSEGFGVLTTIDVSETLRNKIDVDIRPYRILGACNPTFAYKALQAEDKIGTMLPCNVIVQEKGEGRIQVASVDPIASMSAVDNPDLADIASEVREKLRRVVNAL